MTEPGPRFWEVFFEVYEPLPRQGPGNRASAARALDMCPGLPPSPAVLDLGCGSGAQTFHLVELLPGSRITAIDSHPPSIERMREAVAKRGLAERIRPRVGDMARPGLPPASFDLIWSEGALYNIGLENALGICLGLLRSGGYLVFTEAIWRKEDPPAEVKASFDFDYPTMGRVADVVAAIGRTGFSLESHFTLPDEAWWEDFYAPMERRVEELRGKHDGDPEGLAVLDQIAREPEMHRRYSAYYAYEFFVARRPATAGSADCHSRQTRIRLPP